MSFQRWVVGVTAVVVTILIIGAFFLDLDTADKVASIVSVFIAVVGLGLVVIKSRFGRSKPRDVSSEARPISGKPEHNEDIPEGAEPQPPIAIREGRGIQIGDGGIQHNTFTGPDSTNS